MTRHPLGKRKHGRSDLLLLCFALPSFTYSLAVFPSHSVSLFQLSHKRKVSVGSFKGNLLVGIREYWTDKEGKEKPSAKGQSTTAHCSSISSSLLICCFCLLCPLHSLSMQVSHSRWTSGTLSRDILLRLMLLSLTLRNRCCSLSLPLSFS